MSFHEVQFPVGLSFGAIGGPERRTDVVTLSNGFEERNTPWAHSKRRYDAGLGLRAFTDVEAVVAFFEARCGQLFAFRWKDWADYKSCSVQAEVSAVDQDIAVGDGAEKRFQLVKVYKSGEQKYRRPIQKPVDGSLMVALDQVEQVEGVDFTADYTSGVISFVVTPEVGVQISAGFEFDVPGRFDSDQIMTSLSTFQAGDIPDIPVVEVRV